MSNEIKKTDGTPAASAAELAKDYFIYGYHCSEALVKAINEYYELNLDESLLRVTSALSAGLGKAKSVCGTITGGALILGHLYGRTEAHEDDDLVFDLMREYYEKFVEKFGSERCSELTRHSLWGHPDHRVTCAEYVYAATAFLSEILEETQRNLPVENGPRLRDREAEVNNGEI